MLSKTTNTVIRLFTPHTYTGNLLYWLATLLYKARWEISVFAISSSSDKTQYKNVCSLQAFISCIYSTHRTIIHTHHYGHAWKTKNEWKSTSSKVSMQLLYMLAHDNSLGNNFHFLTSFSWSTLSWYEDTLISTLILHGMICCVSNSITREGWRREEEVRIRIGDYERLG